MSVLIRVFKHRRLLEAFDDERRVLSCRVSLGFGAEAGPKRREGDGRTPEGTYFVCTKNAASRFHLSLGISYPNAQDAREAFARGEIDEATCERLIRAAKGSLRPDWQTPLGGFIMLHGEHPEGRAGDWTAGCVALNNDDMEALFSLAGLGDGVEIYP